MSTVMCSTWIGSFFTCKSYKHTSLFCPTSVKLEQNKLSSLWQLPSQANRMFLEEDHTHCEVRHCLSLPKLDWQRKIFPWTNTLAYFDLEVTDEVDKKNFYDSWVQLFTTVSYEFS
jgi:hypothetical protein